MEEVQAEWFAGRLRELREKAGLTQKELADKTGINLGGLRALEQGLNGPTWATLLALCKALTVDCTAFTTPPKAQDKPGPGRPAKPKPDATEAKPKRPRDGPKKGRQPGE